MYIIKYEKSYIWEQWDTVDLFVTSDEEVAIKYVDKFNGLLEKWTEYYGQYIDDSYEGDGSIKEGKEKYFERWNSLDEITKAYYDKIEVR